MQSRPGVTPMGVSELRVPPLQLPSCLCSTLRLLPAPHPAGGWVYHTPSKWAWQGGEPPKLGQVDPEPAGA